MLWVIVIVIKLRQKNKMFLIQKNKEKQICAEYSLKYRLEDGWKLIKPVFDMPRSACYRSVNNRSVIEIKFWYQEKIEALTLKLEGYKRDLKKFEEIIK